VTIVQTPSQASCGNNGEGHLVGLQSLLKGIALNLLLVVIPFANDLIIDVNKCKNGV